MATNEQEQRTDEELWEKLPPGVRLLRTLQHTVKLWEAHSGKLLRTLEGHQSRVYSVTFDPHAGRDAGQRE